jgi:hypothetical protein
MKDGALYPAVIVAKVGKQDVWKRYVVAAAKAN